MKLTKSLPVIKERNCNASLVLDTRTNRKNVSEYPLAIRFTVDRKFFYHQVGGSYSEKCLTFQKSRKSRRAFSRTRKHSRSRLTNGLKMALLPSGIMQMAKTMTSDQRLATLLHGASLPRHSSMVLTQLTRSNAGWLPPIC